MSHSFKHFPTGACCGCKSQHRVKKKAFRRFRSEVNTLIRQQKFGKLPFKSIELTSSWNLGGDGKMFYGIFDPTTNIYRGRKRRYLLEPPLW